MNMNMKKENFYSENVKNMVYELVKNAKQNWRNAQDNYINVIDRDEYKAIIIRHDVIECSPYTCDENKYDLVGWIAREGGVWVTQFINDNSNNATAMALLDAKLAEKYYNKITNMNLNIDCSTNK